MSKLHSSVTYRLTANASTEDVGRVCYWEATHLESALRGGSRPQERWGQRGQPDNRKEEVSSPKPWEMGARIGVITVALEASLPRSQNKNKCLCVFKLSTHTSWKNIHRVNTFINVKRNSHCHFVLLSLSLENSGKALVEANYRNTHTETKKTVEFHLLNCCTSWVFYISLQHDTICTRTLGDTSPWVWGDFRDD